MRHTFNLRRHSSRRLIAAFSMMAVAMIFIGAASMTARGQQSQLSLADLLIGLRSKKVTLPERNKILAGAVKTRGVTFALTPEIEKELEVTGADAELMQAIREKSTIVKVSAVKQPEPESTPAPPEYAAYRDRAHANFTNGDFDLALAGYAKVIELGGGDAKVYLNRGTTHFAKSNFDLAIADFDKSLALDAKQSMAHAMRGNAYEKLGKIEQAAADYEKSLSLNAGNALAMTNLKKIRDEQAVAAAAAKEQEDKDRAAAAAAKQVELNAPADMGALNGLAIRLAVPYYPPMDRKLNIQGLVVVAVELDEEGKVVSAKATSGPKSLQPHAEDAVRKSKFSAPTQNGRAVKATGYISYNFRNGGE